MVVAANDNDGQSEQLACDMEESTSDSKIEDDKYWVTDLLLSNGYEPTKTDCSQVGLLELFLSNLPRVPKLDDFTALSALRLVGCNIEEMKNLDSLSMLRELWICEGAVQKLEGLEHNKFIEKLYLYDNKITKIDNISHLTLLTTLWLNKNRIEVIENLEHLRQLKHLNLSDNLIRNIGTSLICNNLLEQVNLSGNLISSLKDITNLSCLRNLVSLDLRDPMCLPNPVTLLCNYSTYVFYHMPSLRRLDSTDVSHKLLKESTESTVMKKKIFYKMRIRTLKRQCVQYGALLKEKMELLQEGAISSLHKLYNAVKEIERDLDELSTRPGKLGKICSSDTSTTSNTSNCGMEADLMLSQPKQDVGDAKTTVYLKEMDVESKEKQHEKLEWKLEKLKKRISIWEMKFERLEEERKMFYRQLESWCQNSLQYLQLEFSSGGNIRFEDGTPADVWYNSCQDLIQARFSSHEFKDLSINGLKVHKITRVQNRLQKVAFEQKLETMTDECDPGVMYKDNNGRRLMDYLFLIPKLSGEVLEHKKVLEFGITLSVPRDEQIMPAQLTNSIRLFDKHRIKTMTQQNDEEYPYRFESFGNPRTFSSSHFAPTPIHMVNYSSAKFIWGSLLQLGTRKVTSAMYPNHNSVYRTKKHLLSNCPSTKAKKFHLLSSSSACTMASEYCDCTARKCVWFVFDHQMVLPEYIVDFEYLTVTASPLVRIFSNILTSPTEDVPFQQKLEELSLRDAEDEVKDDAALNMEPVVSSRPRLTYLTEDVLVKQTGQSYLNKILELNLHGSGLYKVKLLTTLPNIKKLILSFNELTSMNELGGSTSLEYLDVSFNQITGLEGFKLSPNISFLDISWNRFYYTRDDVGLMRKNLPALKILRASHNPWMKKDNLRLRCIGRLRSLCVMDDRDVSEEETNIAIRLAAGSRIAYITVLANSRTDKEPLRTLNLSSTTDILMSHSLNKPVKLSEDDRQWLLRVTCLRLDGQHLSKISNLEKLESLKWASFNDNDITKIEGLENCKNLLELSLANNCLSKLEGVNHLSNLQSLDVSGNNLSSLDGIDLKLLSKLIFFAFDNNFILSLSGLQHSSSLLEVYAGNNKIQEMRDIFYLKSIPSLIILDLLGNPMVKESSNYRLFLIYHLQTLKALDGVSVNLTEGGLAKDAFGGKLSTDFIAEKLGHSNFLELCELDLPNCNLRTVEIRYAEMFINLRSLNLEQNNLTSFGGIINLQNLKVLCLNHNHIESIIPRKNNHINNIASLANTKNSEPLIDVLPTLLENLEVLHLAYNGISNLPNLELGRLSSLKALFLQGNEISKVHGLDGLYELRELVLDKNKIKSFHEHSFRHQWKLLELHVEENRLRELSNMENLTGLNRLYIGINRIQYTAELEKLECLQNLFELSVIGNPVTRRLLHRPVLVFRQPNLLSIDGIPVTNDERTKAEIYFLEQQGGFQALQSMTNSIEQTFPGLPNNQRNPLKVSNYSSNDRYWNPLHQNISGHTQQDNHEGNIRSNKKPKSNVYLPPNTARNIRNSHDVNRYKNR